MILKPIRKRMGFFVRFRESAFITDVQKPTLRIFVYRAFLLMKSTFGTHL
jgi:hypothetical protein